MFSSVGSESLDSIGKSIRNRLSVLIMEKMIEFWGALLDERVETGEISI